jgi:hypothetical protein
MLRGPGQIAATVVQLTADAPAVLTALGILSRPQWGLFTPTGQPAFAAASSGLASVLTGLLTGPGQSTGDIEFRLDHRISTAPQEQGAFLSYNKVSTPFAGRVTYIVSGTQSQRTEFLGQVFALQNSLTLLTLVMPEFSYPSCTVTHHDFKRSARNGLTMISVDIWVEEVRITGTAAFSNTATPSAAGTTSGGTVQPQTPGTGQVPSAPSNNTGSGTGGATGVGGTGQGSTVGVPSEPYFDAQGNQLGVAPSSTVDPNDTANDISTRTVPRQAGLLPQGGVGFYANGQVVFGGSWQQGFYDSNMNFVHP